MNADEVIEKSGDDALEYLFQLERQKYELLKKKGLVDFDALKEKLRALEAEVSAISAEDSLLEKNGHSTSEELDLSPPSKLKQIVEADSDDSSKIQAKKERRTLKKERRASEHEEVSEALNDSARTLDLDLEHDADHGEHDLESSQRRSSVRSTGSAGGRVHSHTKQSRRASISQPLYTMPNAFQYGIKLRDTKMNGMSMYEETTDRGSLNGAASPQDMRVQGSRERESNIRNITDKFSSENNTDRNSFSMANHISTAGTVGGVSSAEKKRSTSSDANLPYHTMHAAHSTHSHIHPAHAHPHTHSATSTITTITTTTTAQDLNQTMESVDNKLHNLSDLAHALSEHDAEDINLTNNNLNLSHISHHSSRSDTSESTVPEGAIEFCIVEADWAQLHLQSEQGHLLTPLLPPKRSWRYPPDLTDDIQNNTKELQDQSFFFPSGVKVDLVWPSVAALRSRTNKNIRHIVPFTDGQGKPTYACVLTVAQTYETSEIAQYGDLIVPNLVNINLQKQSASCIQKCFRQYVAYRKMVSWQLHKNVFVNVKSSTDSPALQRSNTTIGGLFGRKTIVDTSNHGSTTSDDKTSANTTNTTTATTTSTRRTWTSYFSSGRNKDTIEDSSHGNKPGNAPGTPSNTSASTGNGTGRDSNGGATTRDSGSDAKKSNAQRSASVTATTPTAASTNGGWRRNRHTADAPGTQTIAATAAELEQAEQRRRQAQAEFQAEYVRRRVVVAQKAYCIISTSREYTYIFKVLDAIAAAEGFNDSGRPSKAPLPFSSTLSDDEDDSSDGVYTERSSSVCSISNSHDLLGVSSVLGVAISPITVPHHDTYTTSTNPSSSDDGIHSMYMRNINSEAHITHASPPHTPPLHALHALHSTHTTYASTPKNSISAAVDVYYAQHREKRDKMRYRFLQETESFLLEHLTAPVQTALQQITTEFAFSPAALHHNRYRDFNYRNRNGGNSGSNSRHGNKLRSTDSVYMNQANSPILPPTGRKLTHTTATSNAHTANVSVVSGTSSASAASGVSSLAKLALGHPHNGENNYDDEDVHNRFSHYHHLGQATVHNIKVPGYIEEFRIDLKALLTTKEWTCAILFTHLSSTIIFKIINLLLMEKSLIIHGKNAGIVTSITMAVINLISPFLWEGIFVPLVPDNARELFGAPVPLIVGTTSAPRVTDVSSDTAILFLNDDNVTTTTNHTPYSTTTDVKFVAWFVRLPEVSADLPSELEMCRRIDYTTSMLCKYIQDKIEYKDEVMGRGVSGKYSSVSSTPLHNTNTTSNTITTTSNTTANMTTDTTNANTVANTQPTAVRLFSSTTTTVSRITNTIDSLLMSDLPLDILHHVRVLIVAIKRFNYTFCGVVVNDPGSWKRFLKHSTRTGNDEFYPEYFMEPLRNHLEFQDSIVHTQLFVSFMDKLRKEQCLLDTFRRFLAEWIYFRTHLRRKHKFMKKMLRQLKAK